MKRYVSERGTNWVSAIASPSTGNTITIAQMTQIEVFSGVSRRKREQIITPRGARMIRLLLGRHMLREYQIIEITQPLITTAEDLLDKYPLRAYDSVQLASALIANIRLVGSGVAPLLFVSADTRLLTSATSEGLMVD